jgi:hypothetical protein
VKRHSAKDHLWVALTVAPSVAIPIIVSSLGILKGRPNVLLVLIVLGAITVSAVVMREKRSRDTAAKTRVEDSAMAEERMIGAFNKAKDEAKKEALEVGRDIIARLTSSSLSEAQQHEVSFIVNAAMNKTHPMKLMSISSGVPELGSPTLTERSKR